MLPPMVKQALQLLQYPTSESPIASPPSCECVHDARLESSTNGHGESGSSLAGLTHLFACAGVAGTGSCRRAISEIGQWKRLQQALWSRSGPFIGPIISPIRAWKSLPSQTHAYFQTLSTVGETATVSLDQSRRCSPHSHCWCVTSLRCLVCLPAEDILYYMVCRQPSSSSARRARRGRKATSLDRSPLMRGCMVMTTITYCICRH